MTTAFVIRPCPHSVGAVASTNFWRTGHWPTLVAAMLYFDLAFMVWVILGPLAPEIAASLGLSPAETGLMVATPTLSGALLRVATGVLVDRIGPKLTGAISQSIVIIALLVAWLSGVASFAGTLVLGLVLGFAGASFAIALPLASRWYPIHHQGKAMGLAGMGNGGTVLAALFAPTLARNHNWTGVLGLACIPLSIVLIFYMVVAKDAPDRPPSKRLSAYFEPLKTADSWWLMAFYAITFGTFVGLAASLPIYCTDRFGLDTATVGYWTATCLFAGSIVRPIGGALADRIGGARVLTMIFAMVATLLSWISVASSMTTVLCLFVAVMAVLGIGNGSIFQLVPQRFGEQIGVMTGMVGMAGGIGGFLFATSLGIARQFTGSFSPGLLLFGALAGFTFAALTRLRRCWLTHWGSNARI